MGKPRMPVVENGHSSLDYLRAPAGRSHAEISRLLLESIADYSSSNSRVGDHVEEHADATSISGNEACLK
jgi:hypothetical protein